MKTNNTTTERTQDEIVSLEYDRFTNAYCPFGSMDIRRAVQVCVEVGECGDWAVECINDFADNCGMKNDDLDPVGCVYDAILNEVRNEITELIDFDFLNDGAEINVYSNYCATSFDYRDDANDIIKQKLIDNNIQFSDLSVKAQWFLSQIDANY